MKHKISKLINLFLGLSRHFFYKSRYYIKRGYFHRKNTQYEDNTKLKDEYQKEVYEIAKRLTEEYELKNIIDYGCGSGFKLIKYFSKCNTIGIDVSPTHEFLVKKYPHRRWINAKELNTNKIVADLVICADVIEHVLNPDELLDNIKKIKGFKFLLISTPERDIIRSWYDYGPPENKCHVREWNGMEFDKYISFHFDIISHQITNFRQSTQLIICKSK